MTRSTWRAWVGDAATAAAAGPLPGVVVHGSDNHGSASVARWAALPPSGGHDVVAADRHDVSFESAVGYRSR